MTIKVVDVFAGPGGLNEGFASFETGGVKPFSIALSIEKERVACDTLTLRSALRRVQSSADPLPVAYRSAMQQGQYLPTLESSPKFATAIKTARDHVRHFTLDESSRHLSDQMIARAVGGSGPWILVGGPPCQLYSLVGRARASKLPGFEDDVRHVLYREYLHILNRHRPEAFIMENVKGMLSAMHKDGRIFDLIRDDVAAAGYELRSLVVEHREPERTHFVVRSNLYGVPQKRHRVILFGVRNDLAARKTGSLESSGQLHVRDAIGDLTPVRSRISPLAHDDLREWIDCRNMGLKQAGREEPYDLVTDEIGGRFVTGKGSFQGASRFHQFVGRPALKGFAQHASRSHMKADISRYAFYAQKMLGGERLKVNHLPSALLPNHKNVGHKDTPFTDRFRVQSWDDFSSTVVSHISKDGHYFIHPDPLQARSLTVREVARLQASLMTTSSAGIEQSNTIKWETLCRHSWRIKLRRSYMNSSFDIGTR